MHFFPFHQPHVSLISLVVGVTFATACTGAVPPPKAPEKPATTETPPPPKELTQPKEQDTAPKEEQKPLPFFASGNDATEGQAYESAKRRLLVALLNDESLLTSEPYSDRLTQVVHLQESDPFERTSQAEGVGVKIGLTEQGLDAAFLRLELSLNDVELKDVPPPLSEAVRQVRVTRLRHQLCQRRKTLIEGSTCEAASPEAAEKKLSALLKNVSFTPRYEGGIPSTQESFLRPLSLQAELVERGNKTPLPTLFVLISYGEDAPVSARTDKDGKLIFKIPAEVPTTTKFTISLDGAALLSAPPPAGTMPHLVVSARTVSVARAAVVLLSQNEAAKVTAGVTERSLKDVITRRVSLGRPEADRLAKAGRSHWSKVAPSIADDLAGELDAIVFVEAESEFASRMGTHRVWFEARGKATIISAWTGEVLGDVSSVVTESGVGEERAEQACREALGRDLADKLRQALNDTKAKLGGK